MCLGGCRGETLGRPGRCRASYHLGSHTGLFLLAHKGLPTAGQTQPFGAVRVCSLHSIRGLLNRVAAQMPQPHMSLLSGTAQPSVLHVTCFFRVCFGPTVGCQLCCEALPPGGGCGVFANVSSRSVSCRSNHCLQHRFTQTSTSLHQLSIGHVPAWQVGDWHAPHGQLFAKAAALLAHSAMSTTELKHHGQCCLALQVVQQCLWALIQLMKGLTGAHGCWWV